MARSRKRGNDTPLFRNGYDHAVLTQQTAAATPRAHTAALRPLRLLLLAALLLSLLFAHGLHGESTAGHLEAGVAAAVATDGPEFPADHDHGQSEDSESVESAHNCAPGQPNGSLDAPPPSTSPLEVTCHCALLARSGRHAAIASPDIGSLHPASVLRI